MRSKTLGAERVDRLSVAARPSGTAGVEEIATERGNRQQGERQRGEQQRGNLRLAVATLKGEQLQTKSRGD